MDNLRKYNPGETIIRENEMGETAYLIEQGQVEVLIDVEGREVHLCYLKAGETFGEMSMVDEKPRSASVRAVRETVLVREVHRDRFYACLQSQPEIAVHFLKTLFERLREADMTISNLQSKLKTKEEVCQETPSEHKISFAETVTAMPTKEAAPSLSVSLEGITSNASLSLPVTPLTIDRFPFKIGRITNDPLVHNDLSIPDQPPLQISRHHVGIIKEGNQIGVYDRGSHLGALVDGKRIGGKHGPPGPEFFQGPEGLLILGTDSSPFKFKVNIL